MSRWLAKLGALASTNLARLATRATLVVLASLLGPAAEADAPRAPAFAPVTPGHPLVFPQDAGSHPEFRTEWWYVTGWLDAPAHESLGFQVTFFRTRPGIDEDNPSAFAARQLIIAHAALSDAGRGRLWQDQRIDRAVFGLAAAALEDTRVWVGGWRLEHDPTDLYHADIEADGFALHLALRPTQPPLLEGEGGFSRKGPAPQAASEYYSVPHLAVSGTVTRAGVERAVHGEAWLDHEWSSEYLDSQAAGWDWTGLNFADGSALMAFRIRDLAGHARWAGATFRDPAGRVRSYPMSEICFEPRREWRSPRTGILYPVSFDLRIGEHALTLEPLMPDQENDTRASTGALYWEGAVRALSQGLPIGRGYLELTGYGERLRLR